MNSAKPTSTLMATSVNIRLKDGLDPTNATQYRQLIGSIQYKTLIRPDVAFAINRLSQVMNALIETHWTHIKQILSYLKGTIHHGLFLSKYSSLDVTTFSDADWEGNLGDMSTTKGYVLYLGRNPVAWKSSKQKTVARSSIEAENRSLANIDVKVLWLKNLV